MHRIPQGKRDGADSSDWPKGGACASALNRAAHFPFFLLYHFVSSLIHKGSNIALYSNSNPLFQPRQSLKYHS